MLMKGIAAMVGVRRGIKHAKATNYYIQFADSRSSQLRSDYQWFAPLQLLDMRPYASKQGAKQPETGTNVCREMLPLLSLGVSFVLGFVDRI